MKGAGNGLSCVCCTGSRGVGVRRTPRCRAWPDRSRDNSGKKGGPARTHKEAWSTQEETMSVIVGLDIIIYGAILALILMVVQAGITTHRENRARRRAPAVTRE